MLYCVPLKYGGKHTLIFLSGNGAMYSDEANGSIGGMFGLTGFSPLGLTVGSGYTGVVYAFERQELRIRIQDADHNPLMDNRSINDSITQLLKSMEIYQ